MIQVYRGESMGGSRCARQIAVAPILYSDLPGSGDVRTSEHENSVTPNPLRLTRLLIAAHISVYIIEAYKTYPPLVQRRITRLTRAHHQICFPSLLKNPFDSSRFT